MNLMSHQKIEHTFDRMQTITTRFLAAVNYRGNPALPLFPRYPQSSSSSASTGRSHTAPSSSSRPPYPARPPVHPPLRMSPLGGPSLRGPTPAPGPAPGGPGPAPRGPAPGPAPVPAAPPPVPSSSTDVVLSSAYVDSGDTPDSTLEDQAGGSSGSRFDNLAFDFDFLQGLQSQDELGGSQLGGAPPTWTQEGAGTQLGVSQLPGASGGTQPGGSQLPGVSGGAQPSPGGLLGSSHEVVGSAAAVATPQPTADARCRQIHPRDPLTYPREQTHAAVRAGRLQKKARRC